MKSEIIDLLKKQTSLSKEIISSLIEVPPNSEMGDYAFPCFTLSKKFKKNPAEIAKEISSKLNSEYFEKIESKGPYINFFINRQNLAKEIIRKVSKEKEDYGKYNLGKGKNFVIDMSSPNIAKPFGIGHLRSTIIGNAVSEIAKKLNFNVTKINYLGDWGTPFGKLIAGFKEFGNEKELAKNPIKHLYEIYVKVSKDEKYDELGREWFSKLESGNKEAVSLWKKFREESISEFNKIYQTLGISFDVLSGESEYNNQMDKVVKELEKKKLLTLSEGAYIVDLTSENLGVVLIKKSDGTTLYATRDLAAAIHRKKEYGADYLAYEVGSEQKLHFKQVFRVLELLGYEWAKNCIHIDHGLYLDNDGKKFATRKGKTIFMQDILDETVELAKKELIKREKLDKNELEKRALLIARAAIFYGDLRNHRTNDTIFDISKFLEFEGNTGPYLLYTYARSRSVLKKANYKFSLKIPNNISEKEKQLLLEISKFSEVIRQSHESFSPNLVANYSYGLSQKFNEFYQSEKIIGSEAQQFKLSLVDVFSQTLKNSLTLLGIKTLEKM